MSDLTRRIRQALAELELISHAPTPAYSARTQHGSDEDIGGKRPPGSDREFRPRRPKLPLIDGDPASEKAWREYDEDLAAWEASYHRRTVSYYQRQLRLHGVSSALLEDVERTIRSWRVLQIPAGQPPALGDPQWKRYIGESDLSGGELARIFNVSREYIRQVRKQYRKVA